MRGELVWGRGARSKHLAKWVSGSGTHGSFFKTVGAVSSLRASGGALLFLSQILLAAWMGPEAFGSYSFAWACVAVLSTLAGLGFSGASVRFISRYLAVDEIPRLRGLIRFGRGLTLIVSCAVAAVGIAAVSLLASESPYLGPLQLAFLAIPVIAFMNLEAAYARGFNWMVLASVAEQIGRPTLLIVIGWLTARALGEPYAEPFVLACVLAYLLVTVGQHVVVRSRIRAAIETGPREREPRIWMRFSVAMLLLSGSHTVRINTGLVMVGLFLEPSDVGIYTAAVRTSTLVSLVFMVMGVVAQPTISSMHVRGLKSDLQHFITTAARWIFAASLAIGILVALFGTFVLELFGPDFTDGYEALLILVVGHVLVAGFGPVTSLLTMTGHQDSAALVYGLSALVNIVLNATLIPFLGILGAAVATSLNLFITHLALFWMARRDLQLSSAIIGSET